VFLVTMDSGKHFAADTTRTTWFFFESSAAAAVDRLHQLAAAGRPVAVVFAPAATIRAGGEFLTMAHRLYPDAKRVLMVPRGGPSAPSLRVPAVLVQDQAVAQPVLRAMALGSVDTHLPSPHGPRDEGFRWPPHSG
jgi:hypothetical protein